MIHQFLFQASTWYHKTLYSTAADKEDIIPPVPTLTRFRRESGIKAFVKKELTDPRLPDVRKSNDINVLTTPTLCVQLNTLYVSWSYFSHLCGNVLFPISYAFRFLFLSAWEASMALLSILFLLSFQSCLNSWLPERLMWKDFLIRRLKGVYLFMINSFAFSLAFCFRNNQSPLVDFMWFLGCYISFRVKSWIIQVCVLLKLKLPEDSFNLEKHNK